MEFESSTQCFCQKPLPIISKLYKTETSYVVHIIRNFLETKPYTFLS